MPPSRRFPRNHGKLIPIVKLKWILRANAMVRHRNRKVEPHCHHILKLLPGVQEMWAFQSSVGNGVNSQSAATSSRDRLIEFGFRTVQEKGSIPDAVQKLTGRSVQLFDLKEGRFCVDAIKVAEVFSLWHTVRQKLPPSIFSHHSQHCKVYSAELQSERCRKSESIGVIQGPGELVKNSHELGERPMGTFQWSRPEIDFPIIANKFTTCK